MWMTFPGNDALIISESLYCQGHNIVSHRRTLLPFWKFRGDAVTVDYFPVSANIAAFGETRRLRRRIFPDRLDVHGTGLAFFLLSSATLHRCAAPSPPTPQLALSFIL